MVLSSCISSLEIPELDDGINYKKRLRIKIKLWDKKKQEWCCEKKFTGMGVVKKSNKYKIKVYPPGKADRILLQSCHREIIVEDKKESWFSSGVEFKFSVSKDMETKKACPIDIEINEKKRGRHGWASIIIQSSRENLPAVVKCDGKITSFNGTSVCQSRAGLVQQIIFSRPVLAIKKPGCELDEPQDKMKWEYLMPPGNCAVFFVDAMDERNIHQQIMFGYDRIP